MATSHYIYKTLFLDGIKSDVTIEALNYEWKLHKVYLCQVRKFCKNLKYLILNNWHIKQYIK